MLVERSCGNAALTLSLVGIIRLKERFICLPMWGVPFPITHLDGEFALREVLLTLLGLLQLSRGVLGGQTATDGTGLLGTEIKGLMLLALEEQAHVVSLLGVDDREDTSDRLAEVVAVEINHSRISFVFHSSPVDLRDGVDVSSRSSPKCSPDGRLFLGAGFLPSSVLGDLIGSSLTFCSAWCRRKQSSGCAAGPAPS